MSWRTFFKPTLRKIAVFLFLLLLTIFVPRTTQICSMTPSGEVSCGKTDAQGIGYPLAFGTRYAGDRGTMSVYPLNLL